MGVQDYDDLGFQAPDYYDPDEPFGDDYGTFPTWPGLMDRAQSLTFTPVGLRRNGAPVPTYIANGNHDGLVQGNEDAIAAFEDIATGCFKVAAEHLHAARRPEIPTPTSCSRRASASPSALTGRAAASSTGCELKRMYSSGTQEDGHGFGFVDPAELRGLRVLRHLLGA